MPQSPRLRGVGPVKYSGVAAHLNEPIIRAVPSRPYPDTAMIADPAQTTKSSPGIPRRTASAGNNERIASRTTKHHVRVRNDVETGGIGATLSIAELLASSHT